MIIKDCVDAVIELHKQKLNLKGDVYIYNNHFIESLQSHKNLIPNSNAQTIEEAYNERVQYEEEK